MRNSNTIFKKINIFLFVLSFAVTVKAQSSLTLLSNLSYDGVNTVSNQELSDIWGYAANGNEYAIVGLIDGTSIVDVTNPASPTEVKFFTGASTFWRDIKTYGTYAYVVNEQADGLEIMDLSNLPTSATSTYWTGGTIAGTATTVSFTTAHNIFIDENGIGYIFGANYGVGGTIMIDIAANPTNPPVLGIYNLRYCHDGFVRNDILYSAEINNGIFSIVDVSNKQNPTVLGTKSTTNNFTHNIWPSDNGNFVFTTDEVGGAEIGAYDVTDFTDIQRVDGIRSNPGSNVIVHNTHVLNDFLITSYYKDGVTVVDASCPDILVEVGNYDTFPQGSGGNFDGCWGAYPYLPSGNILASDITNGLFVLDNNYIAASYLIGNVTDENGSNLNNVNVTVSGISQGFTTTDLSGDYKTGITGGGTFQVVYSAAGYVPVAVMVTFAQGVKTVQDVQFQPSTPTCSDGVLNGNEIGIDCGGPDCNACTDCNEIFIDSGGTTSNYSNNESSSVTYCPSVVGEVIQLAFTFVDIEVEESGFGSQDGCWDFLTIYNGSSTSSPVLANTLCGETAVSGQIPFDTSSLLEAGDTFESTDATGCLTVEFISDGFVVNAGWEANVNCINNSCPDPGTCNTDCTLGDLEIWNDTNCACETSSVSVLGCTDLKACNFDASANCNDGSCQFSTVSFKCPANITTVTDTGICGAIVDFNLNFDSCATSITQVSGLASGSLFPEGLTTIVFNVMENGSSYKCTFTVEITDPMGNCINNPTCNDGILNGNETGIDCGGPDCNACADCNEIFVDSGGTTSNYSSNENTTVTYCPSTASEVIQLAFTFVDIEVHTSGNGSQEGCWDFLTIYNGSSTSAPVLANTLCGETAVSGEVPFNANSLLEAGDVFESTDSSGCLTISFSSDASVTNAGWEANVNCINTNICEPSLNITGLIPTGVYNADDIIISDGLININSNGPVSFYAGANANEYILLDAGFVCDTLVDFEAVNIECDPND